MSAIGLGSIPALHAMDANWSLMLNRLSGASLKGGTGGLSLVPRDAWSGADTGIYFWTSIILMVVISIE